MYLVVGNDVAHRLPSLDGDAAEIFFDEWRFQTGLRFEHDFQDFGFAVGIGAEPHHLGARCALCEVVFLVAGNACDGETFHVVKTLFAVAVYDVVDGACVVALEYVEVENVFTDKHLLAHLHDLVFAVFVEDDDVVDVGAVAYKLVALQSGADEALVAVDVEFLVGLDDLGRLDGVETAYGGATGIGGPVFLFQVTEPAYREVGHVGEVVVYLFDVGLDGGNLPVGLVGVEFQDAGHLYLHEAEYVVAGDFAKEILLEWVEPTVDVGHGLVHGGTLFKVFVFVDTLLDEDFFEREEVQRLAQLVALYAQLGLQQRFGAVGVAAQHLAHREEERLVVAYHAAVGRQAHLAVGKGIESVDGFVRRGAGL